MMISCMHAFYSSSCTSYMFSIHLLYFLHVFYASSCTSYMFSIHLPVLPTCFLCIFLYFQHVFYASSCLPVSARQLQNNFSKSIQVPLRFFWLLLLLFGFNLVNYQRHYQCARSGWLSMSIRTLAIKQAHNRTILNSKVWVQSQWGHS